MTTQEGASVQDETVGDKQLSLAAEAIVVGKFGIHAVYRELQRVRGDAIATQAAQLETLRRERREARRMLEDLTPGGSEFFDSPQRCFEFAKRTLTKRHEQLVAAITDRNQCQATLATQAAQITNYEEAVRNLAISGGQLLERIVELERMSEFWKRAALLARDEFVERGDELDRLRAELAEATGQLLSWHYDTKHEWGFPLSEEVWASNPLRQRYKDLTGVDWIEPVETDMEDDDDEESEDA